MQWNATTSYPTDTVVLFNGLSYRSRRLNRNKIPPSQPTFWSQVTTQQPPLLPNNINMQQFLDLLIQQTIVLGSNIPNMPFKSLLSTVFSRASVADASLASITQDIADLQAVDAAFSAQDALHDLAIATVSADLILNSLQDSSVASSVSALSGRIDVIEGNVPNFALATDLSALDTRVGSAENAISAKADASALADLEIITGAIRSDLSSAIVETATKASSSEVATLRSDLSGAIVRIDVVEITANAAATASALEALDTRVTANELALPTKAADADLQAAVGRLDGLDVLVAQKADTTYVDAIDANLASIASVSAVESRVSAVESALPAKAEQSSVDAAVSTLEASIATKAASLTVSDAADYAALIALGASGIGRISSSITLDAFASIGTVVRVLAAGAVSLGDLEMQDGEIYTAIKLADGWAFFVGTSVAAANAAAPTYPAAWASLPNGGYSALRQASEHPSATEGFEIAISPAPNSEFIWAEIPSGKISLGSLGSGKYVSVDPVNYPIASFSHILVTLDGMTTTDAGVNYRAAITSA